jgi:hypothetical protein
MTETTKLIIMLIITGLFLFIGFLSSRKDRGLGKWE